MKQTHVHTPCYATNSRHNRGGINWWCYIVVDVYFMVWEHRQPSAACTLQLPQAGDLGTWGAEHSPGDLSTPQEFLGTSPGSSQVLEAPPQFSPLRDISLGYAECSLVSREGWDFPTYPNISSEIPRTYLVNGETQVGHSQGLRGGILCRNF